MGANEKRAATFHGQDTPDTAALRREAAFALDAQLFRGHEVLTLCDALDAATARAEAAEGHLQAVREFAWGLGASTASRDQILRALEGKPFVETSQLCDCGHPFTDHLHGDARGCVWGWGIPNSLGVLGCRCERWQPKPTEAGEPR